MDRRTATSLTLSTLRCLTNTSKKHSTHLQTSSPGSTSGQERLRRAVRGQTGPRRPHTQSPSSFRAAAKPFVLLFVFDSPTQTGVRRTERSQRKGESTSDPGGRLSCSADKENLLAGYKRERSRPVEGQPADRPGSGPSRSVQVHPGSRGEGEQEISGDLSLSGLNCDVSTSAASL